MKYNYNYTQNEPVEEVVQDLIKVNNERIANYMQVLSPAMRIDIRLLNIFKGIVSESEYCTQELKKLINASTNNLQGRKNPLGNIYKAWTELKGKFTCDNPNGIAASCQYNEQIALHVYASALNTSGAMSEEIRLLIEKQETGLRQTHDQIKKYRESQHVAHYQQVYFN